MSTSEERRGLGSTVLRWFVGPWPYFPSVIFLLITAYLILQNLQLAIVAPASVCHVSCVDVPEWFVPALTQQYGGQLDAKVDAVFIIANAVAAALVMAGLAWLFQRWFCGDAQGTPRRALYLVGLVVIVIVGTAVRVYVFNPLLDVGPPLRVLVPNGVRMFAFVTLLQAVSGQLTERYRRAAHTAVEARAEADRQRLLMLTADEDARREIAAFLHDRVQADLLVVGVELERSRQSNGDADGSIGRAIDDVERIRSIDVRAASRRLSPDFEAVGLDTALDELARSWRGVLAVTFTYEPSRQSSGAWREVPVDAMVAAYRIVEQALLNAVAHGRALAVSVVVTHEADALRLLIEDDGAGMSVTRPVVGRGGTIIDAWVSALGGQWSWGSRAPGPGAWLRAELPIVVVAEE